MFLLQDLYRRTFQKRSNAEPRSTLADKVDLDVGNVDPRTGKEQVTGRFRLTKDVQFVADFGQTGDLRGRVKYLVRFR